MDIPEMVALQLSRRSLDCPALSINVGYKTIDFQLSGSEFEKLRERTFGCI